MDSIAYTIGDNLYLNITNRCTNQCVFCIRYKKKDFNSKYPLWLDKEPTAEEIIRAIGDPTKYKQIVFCGYGEPTIRLDVIKEVAATIRGKTTIRLDTNGHGNLFWGRNILPELKGLIDSISISLNAENAEKYDKICKSIYGHKAFDAIIDFIREAKKYIPQVEASVVDLPSTDKEKCKKLVEELGVSFRVRPYYEECYVR
ncbi:MAG: TatD family nuclease-associated radical SAM protein [Candidatus Margulisiibacteriota bacterium]